MSNIIDKTLVRILKIARSFSIVRTLLYLIGGVLIFIWNEEIEDYIYIIVGVNLIVTSLFEFAEEILKRRYKRAHNHLGSSLFTIIIGILLLTIFHDDVYKVSVMWALVTVVNSIIEVNEGLHEIHEKKAFSIINFVFAIMEIVFSIFLLIEPEENREHFITHIYLLGAGFILESVEVLVKLFVSFFKSKEKNDNIKNESIDSNNGQA